MRYDSIVTLTDGKQYPQSYDFSTFVRDFIFDKDSKITDHTTDYVEFAKKNGTTARFYGTAPHD